MSFQLVAPLIHPWVQPVLGLSLDPESIFLLWSGVVGMGLLDGVLGGDDDDGEADDEDGVVDGGDVMFDDDDDFGDLDDMDGMDDEFGEMDDMDGGGGGGNSQEYEQRISEVEDELADVSSTMSTVRSENEQISETVEEVEDNVRQLLEIYEMVTRGVNPFVDDVQGGGGMGGGGGGSFGVFEDDGSSEPDDIDESISEADAESFFDEELDDGGNQADELDEAFEDEFDEPVDDGLEEDPADGGGTDSDGKSFEDLKAEYDSGEADWTDDEGAGGDSVTINTESEAAPAPDNAVVGELEPDAEEEADEEVDFFEDEEAEVPSEVDEEAVDASEDGAEITKPEDSGEDETGGFNFATTTVADQSGSDKPYLSTLPDGYSSELVVMQWLDHLRSAASTGAALRALRYYEDVGWIGPAVTRDLEDVLIQLDLPRNGEVNDDSTPEEKMDLSMDEHLTSLEYVVQLAGGGPPLAIPAGPQPIGGMVNGI